MPTSSPHFSADALAASLEPPVLVIGGFRYTGRVLSIEEWLPFYGRLATIEAHATAAAANPSMIGSTTALEEGLALARDYLRAIFPRRRLRPFWAPDPVKLLQRAPGDALREAFARFFDLQARTLREQRSTRGPSTRGSNSDDAMMPVGANGRGEP